MHAVGDRCANPLAERSEQRLDLLGLRRLVVAHAAQASGDLLLLGEDRHEQQVHQQRDRGENQRTDDVGHLYTSTFIARTSQIEPTSSISSPMPTISQPSGSVNSGRM